MAYPTLNAFCAAYLVLILHSPKRHENLHSVIPRARNTAIVACSQVAPTREQDRDRDRRGDRDRNRARRER